MHDSEANSALQSRPGPPCIFVIFGASGDLTKRKLIPALFNLRCLGLLPEQFAVIGVAITPGDDASFRAQMSADIKQFSTRPVDEAEWDSFVGSCYYLAGDFNDAAVFSALKAKIDSVRKERRIPGGNVVFNLAVTPTLFGKVASQLGAAGLLAESPDGYRRVIIEKPLDRKSVV